MASFLLHWVVLAVALWATTQVVSGVSIAGPVTFAIAAAVLSIVNTVVRPVLTILTLPITILTLGLFYLVVNGAAFGLAAALVPGFEVRSFWAAVLGAFVTGCAAWVVGLILKPRAAPAPRRG